MITRKHTDGEYRAMIGNQRNERMESLLYNLRCIVSEAELGPEHTLLTQKHVNKAERAILAVVKAIKAVEAAFDVAETVMRCED